MSVVQRQQAAADLSEFSSLAWSVGDLGLSLDLIQGAAGFGTPVLYFGQCVAISFTTTLPTR
jgi:hypothetical protein